MLRATGATHLARPPPHKIAREATCGRASETNDPRGAMRSPGDGRAAPRGMATSDCSSHPAAEPSAALDSLRARSVPLGRDRPASPAQRRFPLRLKPTPETRLRLVRAAALAAGLCLVAEWSLRSLGFAWPSERLRFVVLDPFEDARIRSGESNLRFDVDCLWTPIEGSPTGWPGEVHGREGLIGPVPKLERSDGVLRVLVLGSDSTVAPHVAPRLRWPERMRAELESQGVACEVVNAATPHHSLRQGLGRLRQLGKRWNPDVVLAAYSMANSCRPAPMEASDDDRLEAVRADPELLADWDSLSLGDSLRVCHALRWVATAVFDESYWEGRYSWFVGRRYLQRWQQLEWGGERRVMPDEYEAAVGSIALEARALGAEPVFFVLPGAPGAGDANIRNRYTEILDGVAGRLEARVLDGRSVVATAREPAALFEADESLNTCGHELLAVHAASELLHLLEERR